MIADARDLGQLRTAPWTSIFPGLAIGATVLGFNLLGDALRDALDPRALAAVGEVIPAGSELIP
jgi:ABC-type dipeptide/oligopeptide/nickel transport system permease subunit